MSDKELNTVLLSFIEAIRTVPSGKEAKTLQEQIDNFYANNDIPEEKDILARSGFCEMLSMLAD